MGVRLCVVSRVCAPWAWRVRRRVWPGGTQGTRVGDEKRAGENGKIRNEKKTRGIESRHQTHARVHRADSRVTRVLKFNVKKARAILRV